MRFNKSFGAALILGLLVLGALLSVPVKAEETAAPAQPVLVQAAAAPLTPIQPGTEAPVFMVTKACCLDDWQPGNCPVGQKVFAYCGLQCEGCGPFTCVPNSTFCLR